MSDWEKYDKDAAFARAAAEREARAKSLARQESGDPPLPSSRMLPEVPLFIAGARPMELALCMGRGAALEEGLEMHLSLIGAGYMFFFVSDVPAEVWDTLDSKARWKASLVFRAPREECHGGD